MVTKWQADINNAHVFARGLIAEAYARDEADEAVYGCIPGMCAQAL